LQSEYLYNAMRKLHTRSMTLRKSATRKNMTQLCNLIVEENADKLEIQLRFLGATQNTITLS